VRYGIVSDIHSNLGALEAVLEKLGAVDGLICPGDVVGYGPDPNECCRVLRASNPIKVLGNHDAAVCDLTDISWFSPDSRIAALRNKKVLTVDHLRWLSDFPVTLEARDYILVHGSLAEPLKFHYIWSPATARPCFEEMGDYELCFIGHTHISEVYVQRIGERGVDQLSFERGGKLDFKPGFRYIANVGSVGQPRDGNPMAACGIYDSDAHNVEIIRVAYDIPAVQKRMRDAGLPKRLIKRLDYGG
jgi:predicted phosphodiesterase